MSRTKRLLGFIALLIAMFMGTLDSTIINIALPDIMDYFKAGLNDTSWISTIYVLGLSVFMIPASKIADQYGRKKILMIGLVLFGGSSAMCGVSGSLTFLIAMRMLQGVGGAVITPIVVPMALELYGKEKTQFVAGVIGAATALAAAGGPPIGGLLIKYINWQSIFFVNVPFAAISFVLAVFFVKESYDKTVSKSIDWPGMLTLTATLFMFTFSLLKGSDYGWGSAMIIGMFAGSAVALVLFIITEKKTRAPLVEFSLFKEYTFTASSICYLITGFGIVAPLLIFNYFLQNALGYDALDAALVVMTVSLTVIVAMPLGTAVAGRLGAKPVNFMGVFCMAAGAFMLSKLTLHTSKSVMIADLIVFGVGLGFSCQSLVSSIKHLPQEKSGIGSGVVNAARQIGTCVGIAILVTILNSNVEAAKTNIKNDAELSVNSSNVVGTVKTAIISDIDESMSSGGNNTGKEQKELENKLADDIKAKLEALSDTPRPADSTLASLYDGAGTLNSVQGSVLNGQKKLGNGIQTMSSGIDALQNGIKSLNAGSTALDGGLTQLYTGAQKLNSTSSQGMNTMSAGISQLNDGAQKLLAQFSAGSGTGTPTIYDGVTGISDGNIALSSSLASYVNAADNTYFYMIKSNPYSDKLLEGYKDSLSKAQAAYILAADNSARAQLKQQIMLLSNLVALYTAGTDPAVQTAQQFEEKLVYMASQNEGSRNIVTAGKGLADGAERLASASQKVSSQFRDGSQFKTGVQQLANGTAELKRGAGSLNTLQGFINKLTGSMGQLKSGSTKLVGGTDKLESGITSVKDGSGKLLDGSNKLIDADTKLSAGTAKLQSGAGLIGQKQQIEKLVDEIKANKDDKIAAAFDQTFLVSAVILALCSVCGLFTDKKSDAGE